MPAKENSPRAIPCCYQAEPDRIEGTPQVLLGGPFCSIRVGIRMHRIATVLVFFLATLGLYGLSQPSYAQRLVSGSVVSEKGNPLQGATVVLSIYSTGLQRYGTATDGAGEFRFPDIEDRRYNLTVSFVGYASQIVPLDLRFSDQSRIRIILNTQAIPQTEVVVTTNRAKLQLHPVTVSNLSAERLERLPKMKDLPVLLARLPSTTFYSENGNGIGYSTLRMRGFGQRRLAISINGIPQNDPEEFNVFWINFFDIQGAIDDIQVQRGAGSSFYGPAAIGGAVNIRAFPYRAYPYFKTELGAGTFNTRQITFEANSGLLEGNYVVFGRLSRLLSDGYRDWSWTEFWRFFVGVTKYSPRSSLTLQAYGGPQRDGLAYSGIPKAANKKTIVDEFGTEIDRKYNFSSFDRDLENFRQPHVELHHDLRLSNSARLTQVFFWIQGKGFFDFGGTFRSADYLRLPPGFVPDVDRASPLFISRPDVSVLFRAFLDQWQVGWLPSVTFTGPASTTRIGAEFRLHRSLRWGRIQEAQGIPVELVGSENDVRVYSFRGEKAIASLSGSTLIRPSDQWAIQADVQLTYRSYRIYNEAFFGQEFRVPYVFVNPRVGITFNPEQKVSAYASIAVANREPRLKTLYDGEEAGAGFQPAFFPGPDDSIDFDRPLVDAEQLVDFEIGLIAKGERSHTAMNLFYMGFENEIVPSGGLDQFGVPRTGNADRSRHMGIELESSLVVSPGFVVNGNLTISKNRFLSFEEFVTLPDFSTVRFARDDNPIAGFPDVSGNLGITYTAGGLTVNVHATHVGQQYIDNSGGRLPDDTFSESLVTDAFTLFDGSFRYEFSPASTLAGLQIGLDVNNILDEKVLAYGNVSAVGPQFFPHATRHLFFSASYVVR
ncbi:MAG: TonB-dependent receptor [Rhodothermia bacterium]|nr:MAG: TonB-dependent receptor [Rhodothermia bacterium]